VFPSRSLIRSRRSVHVRSVADEVTLDRFHFVLTVIIPTNAPYPALPPLKRVTGPTSWCDITTYVSPLAIT